MLADEASSLDERELALLKHHLASLLARIWSTRRSHSEIEMDVLRDREKLLALQRRRHLMLKRRESALLSGSGTSARRVPTLVPSSPKRSAQRGSRSWLRAAPRDVTAISTLLSAATDAGSSEGSSAGSSADDEDRSSDAGSGESAGEGEGESGRPRPDAFQCLALALAMAAAEEADNVAVVKRGMRQEQQQQQQQQPQGRELCRYSRLIGLRILFFSACSPDTFVPQSAAVQRALLSCELDLTSAIDSVNAFGSAQLSREVLAFRLGATPENVELLHECNDALAHLVDTETAAHPVPAAAAAAAAVATLLEARECRWDAPPAIGVSVTVGTLSPGLDEAADVAALLAAIGAVVLQSRRTHIAGAGDRNGGDGMACDGDDELMSLFAKNRVPLREGVDDVMHTPEVSRHVIVSFEGFLFAVEIIAESGVAIEPLSLASALREAGVFRTSSHNANSFAFVSQPWGPMVGHPAAPSERQLHRRDWYELRTEILGAGADQVALLQLLESALCVVAIDTPAAAAKPKAPHGDGRDGASLFFSSTQEQHHAYIASRRRAMLPFIQPLGNDPRCAAPHSNRWHLNALTIALDATSGKVSVASASSCLPEMAVSRLRRLAARLGTALCRTDEFASLEAATAIATATGDCNAPLQQFHLSRVAFALLCVMRHAANRPTLHVVRYFRISDLPQHIAAQLQTCEDALEEDVLRGGLQSLCDFSPALARAGGTRADKQPFRDAVAHYFPTTRLVEVSDGGGPLLDIEVANPYLPDQTGHIPRPMIKKIDFFAEASSEIPSCALARKHFAKQLYILERVLRSSDDATMVGGCRTAVRLCEQVISIPASVVAAIMRRTGIACHRLALRCYVRTLLNLSVMHIAFDPSVCGSLPSHVDLSSVVHGVEEKQSNAGGCLQAATRVQCSSVELLRAYEWFFAHFLAQRRPTFERVTKQQIMQWVVASMSAQAHEEQRRPNAAGASAPLGSALAHITALEAAGAVLKGLEITALRSPHSPLCFGFSPALPRPSFVSIDVSSSTPLQHHDANGEGSTGSAGDVLLTGGRDTTVFAYTLVEDDADAAVGVEQHGLQPHRARSGRAAISTYAPLQAVAMALEECAPVIHKHLFDLVS